MTVAQLSVAAGIRVQLCNSRGPESLESAIRELGSAATATTHDRIADDVDLVVLAVPLGAYQNLSASGLAGAIVIDAMNYFPLRDGNLRVLDAGAVTQSRLIQRHLPTSTVVKALNTIDFLRMSSLARPSRSPQRTAITISADDDEARAEVARFLDAIGFDTVDVGGLDESWRAEPNSPAYVEPYFRSRPEDVDIYSRLIHAEDRRVSREQLREIIEGFVPHLGALA